MFDYLDYKPVDNLITPEELSEAFKDFSKLNFLNIKLLDWPKVATSIADDLEYSKVLTERYDTSNKNSLNFVEFCKLMEELWDSADFEKEERCNVAFEKSKDVFVKLFKWLDRDKDGFIEAEDMIYGVSRIMIRDVDLQEIQDLFAKNQKDGKINETTFLLAVVNGELNKTFKDELVTSTFIK